jgi:hypothetical protein
MTTLGNDLEHSNQLLSASLPDRHTRYQMWNTLPDELLVQVGDFLLHRDARCMQTTCVNWENAWTHVSLAVPHPHVRQIEVCDTVHCINRRHIIENIEPLLVFGDPSQLDVHRMLQFMVLLVPLKILSCVIGLCRLPLLQLQFQEIERSLVFWCTCERFQGIPGVCLRGEEEDYIRGTARPDVYEQEHLVVWCFIGMMISWLLFLSMVIIVTNSVFMFGLVVVLKEITRLSG